jgi:flagellar biosynthesis chaperone FliJ
MEWMASDAERREQSEYVEVLEDRISQSQQTVDGLRLSSLASHHLYVYSLEMRRRKEEGILEEIVEEADKKRKVMQERALERRTIDAVAERRAEERRVEEKRKETKELSEHGVMRWQTKKSRPD